MASGELVPQKLPEKFGVKKQIVVKISFSQQKAGRKNDKGKKEIKKEIFLLDQTGSLLGIERFSLSAGKLLP
jgi:hypothetical protein